MVEVLEDPNDAGGLGRRAVGRHRHEIELEREPDVPREIGHHDERSLEDPDEQEMPAFVVPRDLLAHLDELALDLVRLDQDVLDVVGVGLHRSRESTPRPRRACACAAP